MKVVGKKCGDEVKSMSFNKVTENFDVGVRGIEEICIKITCDDHVLVVGREVGQSFKEFYKGKTPGCLYTSAM